MTIQSDISRNDYLGNGVTSSYSYTFSIDDEDDIRVIVRDDDGLEEVLVLTTDYTVAGVGDSGGGSITLLGGPLESGCGLTIRRIVDITQLADIRSLGDFYPEVHEDVFDKLTRIDQQQQDEIDR